MERKGKDVVNTIQLMGEQSKSYLSFRIDKELFALHVAHVNNIIEVPGITSVPNSPDYLRGVINLRGEILPVIDTRVKLGLSPVHITPVTCILVVEILTEYKITQLGILVDQVHEVLEIDSSNIIPIKNIKGSVNEGHHIKGVIEKNEILILLIDIGTLIHNEDIEGIRNEYEQDDIIIT